MESIPTCGFGAILLNEIETGTMTQIGQVRSRWDSEKEFTGYDGPSFGLSQPQSASACEGEKEKKEAIVNFQIGLPQTGQFESLWQELTSRAPSR